MIYLVVYGDFNCPFSALASERVDELERRGIATVEWRAVEHDRGIPAAGVEISGDVAQMLTDELAQIRGLLDRGEPDRLQLPICQVSTRLAITRYAGTPNESRPELRHEIFASHWQRAERIDDAAVLDDLGAGPANNVVAEEWRAAWQAATDPIVPVLVLPDGYVSRGLGALARLAGLLA